MAEAILSTVAGEILVKLGLDAVQEIGLLWGVKDELNKLKRTVSTIQAVLLDAEKQPTMSEQCKNYIKNLKEVLYDADDLLDDFSTEALQPQVKSGNKMAKEVHIFFSRSNQLVYGLKMAHEIKAIREKLDAIKGDQEFHIGQGTVETQLVTNYRETHSYIVAKEVIGRDDAKIKIIELLMNSYAAENVSIISIVGIGGLGKTTLAQLVYNDDEVKNHFNLKMWVCVSDVFDVKIIVENIIKSATRREPGNLKLDQLQGLLRKELEGKKYLLVLDDVWNEDSEKWCGLKRLLMGGAKGSRIVLTTRSQRVAEITSTFSPYIYILKGLSDTDSWRLFEQIVFKQGKGPTNQIIVAIGKEIVKKCVGVPLAIRTIGSVFYFKKSEEEWRSVESELSKLPQKEGGILPTLQLSYNNLESHLKHCFAYCMMFRKDHEIDVQTLIYLWMAQGCIKPSNSSQSLEQIGYEYFLFLLWRCFFQEPKEDEWGNIVGCKMHDLMHDLAVEVAGEESSMISSDKANIPINTRHVSINHDFDSSQKIPASLLKANNIRTFLLMEDCSTSSDKEIWSRAIVSKFRRLRMLDLSGLGIKRVPHSIGKLKHLRYLDLSNNHDIEMLPSSITRLLNLLVLKLYQCANLKELPEDIKKLVSLTILEIDGCNSLSHMPQGLGELTSLEKLTKFVVSNDHSVKHCGGLNELNGLNKLRGELRLENLKHVKNVDSEYKAANLEEKEHLQSLILDWEGDSEDVEDIDVDVMSMEGLQPHSNLRQLRVLHYPGVSSPSWLSSLTNLVKLRLEDCPRVKHLPPLDGFTSLQHLSIKGLNDLECIQCGMSSFTNLVKLTLLDCPRVKHLLLLDGLTCLRHLSIKGLTDLEYIYLNGSNCSKPTFFPSLEELEIRKCLNLKGWRIFSMEISTTELPPFPCLSKLEIFYCDNLTSMPLFPSIQGELEWLGNSGKPLQQTMMMKSKAKAIASTSTSSPPLPLSKLKSVWIHHVHDLEYLLDEGMRNLTSLEYLYIRGCDGLLNLAGEGFNCLTSLHFLSINGCKRLKSISGVLQHCTALKKLYIRDCKELDFSDGMQCQGLRSLSSLEIKKLPQLVSLPEGLQCVTTLKSLQICDCERLRTLSPVFEQHLTMLEQLRIERCYELDLSDVDIQFQDSRSLRSLTLGSIPKMVSLPEWLQHVTTLQVLFIFGCNDFKTLPDWIANLTSLQKLKIHFCSKLTLPEEMGRLTSLQILEIVKCPQVSIRCGNNMGVDWPKIAHIPNINIDNKQIQSRGIYRLE